MKKSQIMYMELKYADPYEAEGNDPKPTIGRVSFSKTGKTLYYKNWVFSSLKGGYKANYYDQNLCDWWISGCKRDGSDSLYPLIILVDQDVRDEYWTKIRRMPDQKSQSKFKSNGKYQIGRVSLPRKAYSTRSGKSLSHARGAKRFTIDGRRYKARLKGLG